MMFYSDDPIRDAERYHGEAEVIGKCEHCGDDIYEGEDYYDIEGEIIHEDCLREWAEKYLVRA